MNNYLLYHATDFKSMQSIIRDGVLKAKSGELCFSADCVMNYGEYCVRLRHKVVLSPKFRSKPKRSKWIIGGRGSKGEILKVATTQNIPISKLIFYKVITAGYGVVPKLTRIDDPYKFFNVQRPDVDSLMAKSKDEWMKGLGFEPYYDEESKKIDLLEGVPSSVREVIRRLVEKGANPMGFTYYKEEDELYYFGNQIA